MSQKLISKATRNFLHVDLQERIEWASAVTTDASMLASMTTDKLTLHNFALWKLGEEALTAANGPTRNGTTDQRANRERNNGTTGRGQRDNGNGPSGKGSTGPRDNGNGPTGHRESQPSLKLDAFGMFGPV